MSSLRLAAFLVLTTVVCGAASPKIPTFFDRRDYPGLYGTFVQVADTNGDGIPDIIASQYKTGYIEVLLGNGDGTFRTGPSSLTLATGADSFAATDLNGDGKIDLALANYSGIVVAIGNGNGTFGSGVLYPIDDVEVSFLVAGDFNNDGIPDIAAAGSAGLWLLTGKAGGLFNSAVLVASLPGSANVAAADFNQDGNLDVVVTQPNETNGGFAVLFGQGNGAFQTPQMFGAGLMPNALAVGSLTPGGPPSIAVDDYNVNLSQVDLYYGNGAGGFSAPNVVTLPEVGVEGLSIGDVNGDGIPDLVSDNGYVVFGEAGGSFSKPVNYPVSNAGTYGITNAVLADLRRSGGLDIVTNGGADSISVLLNLGKGFFADGIFTEVGQGPLCAAGADFNGDGKPDLAVSTFQYGATILLGTGKFETPFTTGTTLAGNGGGSCSVVGDLNGDGIPDVLVPEYTLAVSTVRAYLGNGDGTFTLAGATSTPSEGALVLADFNHDGKLDFATSGNLIALGNGDGTFQTPTPIVVPSSGFSGIAAGDINNDGWPDLVLIGSNVLVLLNNQHGGFTQVPSAIVGSAPILADLNGDGNLDLIVLSDSGNSSAYLGNGQGGFTFKAGFGGKVYLVADVNGDGIPDVGTSAFGTLEIYLGESGATYATPFAIGALLGTDRMVVEDLHGQSPASGLPDLVVPGFSGIQVLFNLTK